MDVQPLRRQRGDRELALPTRPAAVEDARAVHRRPELTADARERHDGVCVHHAAGRGAAAREVVADAQGIADVGEGGDLVEVSADIKRVALNAQGAHGAIRAGIPPGDFPARRIE